MKTEPLPPTDRVPCDQILPTCIQGDLNTGRSIIPVVKPFYTGSLQQSLNQQLFYAVWLSELYSGR